MRENRVFGVGVSGGIRFGKAWVHRNSSYNEQMSYEKTIADSRVEEEVCRLMQAKEKCHSELESLIELARARIGEEKTGIFKGHLSILSDPAFYSDLENLVRTSRYSAERAIHHVIESFVALFSGMDNAYLKERAADIRDVGTRLLLHLNDQYRHTLSEIRREVILVAVGYREVR